MNGKLNIGCGKMTLDGFINLDERPNPGVDILFDLETCAIKRMPLESSTINYMLASHVLEHIENIIPLMSELWRVAAPNCLLDVRLPYGFSDKAFADPTHKRPFFERSFKYFEHAFYDFADYGLRGDWETTELSFFVSKQNYNGEDVNTALKRIQTEFNYVEEMRAQLIARKPMREGKTNISKPKRSIHISQR